eukprot:1544999-Rhodomonas_salina.3
MIGSRSGGGAVRVDEGGVGPHPSPLPKHCPRDWHPRPCSDPGLLPPFSGTAAAAAPARSPPGQSRWSGQCRSSPSCQCPGQCQPVWFQVERAQRPG